jgi:hypothetical protein
MKEFLVFILFLIVDFILFEVFTDYSNGKYFEIIFLPIIFLEIALFGCIILYKLNHKDKGGDNDE